MRFQGAGSLIVGARVGTRGKGIVADRWHWSRNRVSFSICSGGLRWSDPTRSAALRRTGKGLHDSYMTPRVVHSQSKDSQSVPTLRKPRYSQSLERGLAILGCFTPERHALGIAEIADQLGMSRSTTHRYVVTLVALRFLEQVASHKYRLGLRVTDLGVAALNATGLRQHSCVYLQELRQRTTCTASLSVLDGLEIVYVDRARSFWRGKSITAFDIRAGSRQPAYATAMGKVLMAYVPGVERRRLVSELTLTKCGPHTVGSKAALQRELVHVRKVGMAVNDEELTASLVAIAVPVRDSDDDVMAAVGLSAHTSMISLEDMVDQLLPHLQTTADHISVRLGYRRDYEQRV